MEWEGTCCTRTHNERRDNISSLIRRLLQRGKLTLMIRMEVSEGRAFIAGVVDGLRYVYKPLLPDKHINGSGS